MVDFSILFLFIMMMCLVIVFVFRVFRAVFYYCYYFLVINDYFTYILEYIKFVINLILFSLFKIIMLLVLLYPLFIYKFGYNNAFDCYSIWLQQNLQLLGMINTLKKTLF